MPNPLAHFAIHATDVERAKRFYGAVFGWSFRPFGPPGFWLISTGQAAVGGALQQRHEPLTGTGMRGYECSFAVDDLPATQAAITANGGRITRPPFHIERVGTVLAFEDTEGNCACAMQYLPGVLESR